MEPSTPIVNTLVLPVGTDDAAAVKLAAPVHDVAPVQNEAAVHNVAPVQNEASVVHNVAPAPTAVAAAEAATTPPPPVSKASHGRQRQRPRVAAAPARPLGFRQWLRRHEDRNDPIGDLARDCAMDPRCPRTFGQPEQQRRVWVQFLRRVHACDGALRAVKEAFREYVQYRGS